MECNKFLNMERMIEWVRFSLNHKVTGMQGTKRGQWLIYIHGFLLWFEFVVALLCIDMVLCHGYLIDHCCFSAL
ncbi:hypothetical protein EUTSA_v10010879mg [Eutrema salsugineum]|uniref:Uncharacterized protein n=1 Tax=Eutrema salsugineum TaxID=72664 RepID=V4NHW3_EUTSA|nr:hypothetical protein EUTSA_v10010879mg [Eutrema salsugineum]